METSEIGIETIEEKKDITEESISVNKSEIIYIEQPLQLFFVKLIALSLFVLLLINKKKSMPPKTEEVSRDAYYAPWNVTTGSFADGTIIPDTIQKGRNSFMASAASVILSMVKQDINRSLPVNDKRKENNITDSTTDISAKPKGFKRS